MQRGVPVLIVLLALGGLVTAQSRTQTPQQPQSQTYSAGATAVLVDVVVRTKQGKPIHGLTADDETQTADPFHNPQNGLGNVGRCGFNEQSQPGQHGFALPGQMTDWAIAICRETYGSTDPQCDADNFVGKTYDVGWFMFHTFGKFLKEPGTVPYAYGCWQKQGCNNIGEVPPPRDAASLP